MEIQQEKFEAWALVELFGHTRVVGWVSEMTIGGGSFIRVDVPGGATRIFGHAAIYAISPITEEIARKLSAAIPAPPIEPWVVRRLLRPAASGGNDENDVHGHFEVEDI